MRLRRKPEPVVEPTVDVPSARGKPAETFDRLAQAAAERRRRAQIVAVEGAPLDTPAGKALWEAQRRQALDRSERAGEVGFDDDRFVR